MSCCTCLSSHEKTLELIREGKADPKRALHKRLYAMADKFVGTTPYIDMERGKLFTESMKETEGEHLTLRWAKALMHIAKNITVYVDDLQLLAGRCGTDKGRYGILYPELDGDFFADVLETVAGRKDVALLVSKEDVKMAKTEIAPYWTGKTLHEDIVLHLPDFCKRLSYNDPLGRDPRFIAIECATQRAGTNWTPDYAKVLNKGMAWVKAQAQAKIDALDPTDIAASVEKKPFYEAIIITADAIVLWARRHAVLAREKAAKCTDPVRKAELLKIAEHCEWVPEHPARTFHEALQSQWFLQAFCRFEHRAGGVVTNGRMDQYLYPFYKKDKEEGRITDDQVLELLDCLWGAIAQYIDVSITPVSAKLLNGYASWETVTVGGQDRSGHDATNELSYLILKSRQDCPLPHPELSARIHSGSPERYMRMVAETIKMGMGFPKVINDHEIINHFMAQGAPLADCLDYIHSGCTEVRLGNRDVNTTPTTQVNFPAFVELTLYNGHMLKHGDELLTFASGDPRTFATWEEFFDAFTSQLKYGLKVAFTNQYIIHRLRAAHFAGPLASGLHDLCFEYAIDLHDYRHVPGSIDSTYFNCFGYATTIDSLSAIKKFVYDEKTVSMDLLLTALRANFEGYEDLRVMLNGAPAFGNNDPYADSIGLELDRISQQFCIDYEYSLGHRMSYRMVSVTGNVPHGAEVSATPNGRKAYEPISDNCSASHGVDTSGPTAVLLSNYNTKNFGMSHYAARLLNLKLTPACVRGEEGTRNLMSLLRAIIDLKLWHAQFNVINRETLIAAQQHPEQYKNLLVRVSGFSAYFTDLSKAMQDDIIGRTGYETI